MWQRPLHKLIKNTLWVVEDMISFNAGGEATMRHRQIVCYQLDWFPRERGWGKHAEVEGSGFTSYNCPLKFLDAAPVFNEDWVLRSGRSTAASARPKAKPLSYTGACGATTTRSGTRNCAGSPR